MAKMFYTLEEAASRLKMDEAEVRKLAETGQLQEFRDRDRLMFKVDQVDLLAGDDSGSDDSGMDEINLGDSVLGGGDLGEGTGTPGLADSLGGGSASFGAISLADSSNESAMDLGGDDDDTDDLAPTDLSSKSSGDSDDPLGLDDSDELSSGPLMGDDDEDEIQLGESSLEPLSLSESGGGSAFDMSPEDENEQTGVSIFDVSDESGIDASAETLVTDSPSLPALDDDFDPSASGTMGGSGLARLTLEPDDTSLGASLLDELDSDDDGMAATMPSQTVADSSDDSQMIGGSAIAPAMVTADSSGALFESSGGGESEFSSSQPMAPAGLMATEAYDGPWSGITLGASLAITLLLVATLSIMVLTMTGNALADVLTGFNDTTILIVAGGGLGAVLLFAAIGWFGMRKS